LNVELTKAEELLKTTPALLVLKVKFPVIVGVVNAGLVSVLLVSVCVELAFTSVAVDAGIVTVTLLAVSAGLSVTDPALGVLSFRDPLIVYSSVFS
jgi:hypothetical protein